MKAIATLAERLRTYRAAHRLKQAEVAEALHVEAATVGRWERGEIEPPLDRVVAMAAWMRCTTDYLLGAASTPIATAQLPPNHWIVDLDALEAVRDGRGVSKELWGAAIPERYRIVNAVEFDRLRREVEIPLPRRKKRP